MVIRRPGRRWGLGVLVLATITSSAGWYADTHPSHEQHFDSCQVLPDGTVILGYTYGVGDRITTAVQPTASAINVLLHLEPASGPPPAVALFGQLRFDAFGGLRGRPVKHADGTVLPCADGRS